MLTYTLDTIVRRYLLERGLPIHWYAEVLFHGATAIRELSKDSLQLVNTVRLPKNSYNAIELPADFVDDVAVAIAVGGRLQPVAKVSNLNPLHNRDSSGAFVPYTTGSTSSSSNYFPATWSWFFNVNDLGESTGRQFGRSPASASGYQVFRERREIQLTDAFAADEAVLVYISDGQRADNASQVDTRVVQAIHSYVDWKRSPQAANIYSPEAKTYHNEKRLFRANMDELTLTDIKDIFRRSYLATIKN